MKRTSRRRLPGAALTCAVLMLMSAQAEALIWDQNPDCDPNGPLTFDIALRLDFSDLSPLVCPNKKDFISAQGASFGLTRSLSGQTTTAAADGLLTASVRYYGSSPFNGITVGAYTQLSGSYLLAQSVASSFTSGSLTPGIFTQFGFFNPIGQWGGLDNFRFRAGEVMASSGARSTSLVGEWFPAYALPVPFFFGNRVDVAPTPFFYTLNPELMVQYDRFQRGPGRAFLFAERDDALRLGPQIGLSLGVAPERVPSFFGAEITHFLAATTAMVVYHAAVDIYTGRRLSSASISITHAVSPNVGISASYSTGNSEATGNVGASVKLGLSAKL